MIDLLSQLRPLTTISSKQPIFVGSFAFHALMLGCVHTEQTENLLSAAGFSTMTVHTPRQQQHRKDL
jgi:hypothetical protein